MTSDAVALDRARLFGDETIATPFGVVQLDHSFPADEPSVLLFDLDAQRAAQAYFWPLPLVGFAVFRDEQARVYEAARFGDFVVFDSLREKRGIVTANLTTPYILNWTDLSDRPALIDYPPGQTAGGVLDFWQRPVADLGLTGPDQGKGGNYMVIAPREDASRHAGSGRIVIQSATSNVMIRLRLLNPDPQAEAEFKAALAMSRLGEELRPGGSPGGGAGRREVDARYLWGTWQVDQGHQLGRQVAIVLAWQVTRYATCLRFAGIGCRRIVPGSCRGLCSLPWRASAPSRGAPVPRSSWWLVPE